MKKLFLILFLVCYVWTAEAETKRFFVNRFDVSHGLASNEVRAVFIDDKGFLWTGGLNGLQRFDGRKFMTYEIHSPNRQPTQPVSEIKKDKKGNMWLRVGSDYGIYQPENQVFIKIPFEKNEYKNQDQALWMDKEGKLFVILENDKILWIDQQNGVITERNNPIRIPDGWRPRSIFQDDKGLYWVSCIEGIAVFDSKREKIYTQENNPLKLDLLNNPDFTSVVNVYQDMKGTFWVNYWAPNEKLVSHHPITKAMKNHKEELTPITDNYTEAFGVLELPNGELWRYGTQTLANYDRKTDRYIPVSQSDLKFDKLNSMIWDPSGGLWLATDGGLYFLHFDTPDLFFYQLETDSGNNELMSVTQIIHQGDTTVWLGSWGKGIKIWKPETGEVNSDWVRKGMPSKPEFSQVWRIHYDQKRELVWVGLQKGILQVIDLKTRKSTFVQPEAFGGSTIRAIAQDDKDQIWFGTQNGTIIKYAGEGFSLDGFQRFRKLNGIIPQIVVSKDQKVWVTSASEGVYVFEPDNGKMIRHLDQSILSSSNIKNILQLNDSIYLIGSDLLNKYNVVTGKNQVFSHSDGLLSNMISHMESDLDGLVWIYTPNGLTRFDALTNSFSSFGKNHFFAHLPNDGHSGTRFDDGQLAFVSNNALLIFNPLQFDRNLNPPKPVITGIELFGEYLGFATDTDMQRSFDSHQNSLSFDFNVLNFPIQDRFNYYYRLVGADQNWIQSKGSFKAVYSLLPPGEYQFEVKTANELGAFSEVAVYPFEIKPSLVQTWWFKAFLALIFLGIVVLIYRMHIYRILELVKIRGRLARDLHDDMGSTLSTINILSSMAKTKLGTDPAKTSEFLSKISENSQRMMESMDDIVWSIKPQNDSMEKLIARMREFGNQVLESKDIVFSIEMEERVLGLKLSMDARRDLFLIFKEGINNAAKYSAASRVFISFKIEGAYFIMRIRDYGKGFDLENLGDGNGLENMKKRAANLNGVLEIITEPEKGTELKLKVQL